ncbi:TrmH family RNA methyltransferase [Aequitasia blattaphilus]|uniref:RNA methyltransferase n=1 Tax=Aequitasia blattaphilus TaxID=2949332 RepID=A0ABT1E953_9FIRM|nr:RNA methyltransferase [Aequitasia blattaphilus]MCP1101047.1 RNA methyltransferase [Aequitasia blattaphilus]MCR8613687.1 RNA methyltransferase [Aequitasia blattaphilus]
MISSTANPKVKELVQLKKKKKERDQQKAYLVEGLRMAREVPKADILKIYTTEKFYRSNRQFFEKKQEPILLSDTVFQYVSDTKTPQGILLVVRQRAYTEEDLMGQKNPCFLILENVQDPGNVGTILRSAEGAGISGILLSKDCADLYNPKTIRSTMGSIFRIPFCYTDDLKASILKLKNSNITLYSADLDGEASYDEATYQRACGFLIGNEGNGLTKEISDLADEKIYIPMKGEVESLNASIAATILMFEVARQRRREE